MTKPSCADNGPCKEEVICTPENCPYGQKGWRHTIHCIKHTCAHDFESGPWIKYENGGTASCACGLTAMSHSRMYGP